jgi:hypothetical protein
MGSVHDKKQNQSRGFQLVRNIAVCVEFTLPRQICFVIVVGESIVQKREIDGSKPPLK